MEIHDGALFPVPPEVFRANVSYNDFAAGETLHPAAGITLRTTAAQSSRRRDGLPDRIRGRSMCYLTDTEHVAGAPDRNILGLIAGADW